MQGSKMSDESGKLGVRASLNSWVDWVAPAIALAMLISYPLLVWLGERER
jgi:hypothetical protein